MKRGSMIKFGIHRIQGAAAVARGTSFTKMWSRSMFQVACLLTVWGTSALTGAGDRQPNLVILFADDLGYGELSSQGNPEIPTPHIDSIARNGVRFTSGYVAGPNCSPSRAGLLTGRTPTRFGYEFNPTGALNEEPGFGLPSKEITIAEALHDAGYTTGLIGKWHQGGTARYHPSRHGFDEFFGFTHEGHYFVPPPYRGVTTLLRRKTLPGGAKGFWTGKGGLHYHDIMGGDEPDYDANNPIVRGGQPVLETQYLTDALTREAVDFIDRHDDKPFFLYLAYPLDPRKGRLDEVSSLVGPPLSLRKKTIVFSSCPDFRNCCNTCLLYTSPSPRDRG